MWHWNFTMPHRGIFWIVQHNRGNNRGKIIEVEKGVMAMMISILVSGRNIALSLYLYLCLSLLSTPLLSYSLLFSTLNLSSPLHSSLFSLHFFLSTRCQVTFNSVVEFGGWNLPMAVSLKFLTSITTVFFSAILSWNSFGDKCVPPNSNGASTGLKPYVTIYVGEETNINEIRLRNVSHNKVKYWCRCR